MNAFVKEPHSPTAMKGLPWAVCKYCGLVYLKNSATAFAVKHGCNYVDAPGWAAALKESVR